MPAEFAPPASGRLAAAPWGPLARGWIAAHLLSQAVSACVIAGLAHIALAAGWSLRSPWIAVIAGTIVLVHALTFGYLRARVLRDRLGRFPMRLWCVVAGFTGLAGLLAAAALPDLVPGTDSVVGRSFVSVLPAAAQSGLGYGLAVGGVEALLIAQVARGVLPWIFLSGIGWCAAHVVTIAGAALAAGRTGLSDLEMAIAGLSIGLSAAFAVAIATLPALRGLRAA